jgi:hypothetical protein
MDFQMMLDRALSVRVVLTEAISSLLPSQKYYRLPIWRASYAPPIEPSQQPQSSRALQD